MGESHYVTQEGLDKLREELAAMIAERPVISRAIAEARDKGDLSENAEYDAAREAQGMLELKISKMQDLIANAKVIDESKINTDTVQMLTKVKLKNLGTGAVVSYTFVGESEANILEGKLAMTTPIGKALMGHRKGEVVKAIVLAVDHKGIFTVLIQLDRRIPQGHADGEVLVSLLPERQGRAVGNVPEGLGDLSVHRLPIDLNFT